MITLEPDDFPAGFTADCSHTGHCDDDVDRWVREIGLAVDPEDAVRYLKPYGHGARRSLPTIRRTSAACSGSPRAPSPPARWPILT